MREAEVAKWCSRSFVLDDAGSRGESERPSLSLGEVLKGFGLEEATYTKVPGSVSTDNQ